MVKEATWQRPPSAPTAAASAGPTNQDAWHVLLKEMLHVMLRHPWLLAFVILPNVISPAIAPVQAWLAKEVLNRIAKGEHSFMLVDLLTYAPIAVGIFLGLSVLQVAEKLTNRMLDERLLIDLQRGWFDRRGDGCVGEHVACSLNDCKNAIKILDLFQNEFWVALIGLPAVLIWQLSLAPELLPALLVAGFLPFLASLAFGAFIQQYSHGGLHLVASVSSSVAQGDRVKLHREQEKFYVNRIKFELSKQGSEVISDFAFWVALVLVLLLSSSGVLRLMPDELTASQIGVFLVNLKLLNKPLQSLTKVHNKFREGWPAVRRVLRPQDEQKTSHA